MFTPIFIGASSYGYYLFFEIMNFLFIPVIFWFYPETAGRTLEQIDVIFAKSYVDMRLPWRVAASLPHLNFKEQEEEGIKLGLYDIDFEKDGFEHENISTHSSGQPEVDGDDSNDAPLVKPAEA